MVTVTEFTGFVWPQWIERPPGFWKVIGSNPVGDSDFFSLFHARDMLIITSSQKVFCLKNIRICVNVDSYTKLTNEPKAQRL